MANAVTISRLGFLAICLFLLYQPDNIANLVAFVLVLLIIFLDGIDGTIARRRGKATPLGSILDIAIDRVVENVFWIVFVDLGLVPVWVALIIVTRGILTDAVRGFALAQGLTPFAMMGTEWGKWLVSHRFMRAVSGVSKVVTWAALVLYFGLQRTWLGTSNEGYLGVMETAVNLLIGFTVAVNLARGIPVLIESRRFFIQAQQP